MTTRASATLVTVDEHRVRLSNQDKFLFPEAGFTKADLVDYYRRIAPVLLPHLAGRVEREGDVAAAILRGGPALPNDQGCRTTETAS